MVKRYGFLIIVFVFLLSIISSCYAQTPSSSVKVEVKPRIKYCDNSCDTYKYLLVGRFGSNSDNDVLSFADHAYMRFKVKNGDLLVDMKGSNTDFGAKNITDESACGYHKIHWFSFCCDENSACPALDRPHCSFGSLGNDYCLCDFLEEPVRLCYQDDWISFDELKSALTGRSVFKNFVFYFSLLSKDITNYDETSDDPSLDYTEGGWCNKGGQGECKNKFSEGDSFVFERGDSNVGYKFKSHYLSDEEDVLRNYIKLEHGHIYDARANPFIYKKMNDYTEDLDIGPHPTLVFEISPDKDFAKHVGYKWYDEEWKAYTFEKFNLCTNEEKVLYLAYKPESEKGLKKSYIHLRVKNNGEKTILIYLNKSKSYAIYACIDSNGNEKCDGDEHEDAFDCSDNLDNDGDDLTDCEDPNCCNEEVCREICAQRECGEEGGVWNSEIWECCGDSTQDLGLLKDNYLCSAEISDGVYSSWQWISGEQREEGTIIDFSDIFKSFATNGEEWYRCVLVGGEDHNLTPGQTLPVPEGSIFQGCPEVEGYNIVSSGDSFVECQYKYGSSFYGPCDCVSQNPPQNFCQALHNAIGIYYDSLPFICGVNQQQPGGGGGGSGTTSQFLPYDQCAGLSVVNCLGDLATIEQNCEDLGGNIVREGEHCLGDSVVFQDTSGNPVMCCLGEITIDLHCGDPGTYTCGYGEYCPESFTIHDSGEECCNIPCTPSIQLVDKAESIICYNYSLYIGDSLYTYGRFGECCKNCLNPMSASLFGRGSSTSTVKSFDDFDNGVHNSKVWRFTGSATLFFNNRTGGKLSFFIASTNLSAVNVTIPNCDIANKEISNYVIGPATSNRWHRVEIPLGYCNIDSLHFDVPDNVVVLLDDVSLSVSNNDYYCTGIFGRWLSDLDPNDPDISKSIFAYACNGFAAYGWTGNYCCGDDGVETYNDTIAGCYEGMIVPNNWRVGDAVNNISLNNILFFNHSFKVCGPSINDWENYSQYSILGRYYCGEDNKWYLLEDMPVVSVIGSTILQQLEQPYYLLCDNFSRIVVADHSKVGDDLLNAFDYGCIGRDDSKVIIGLHRIDKSYNYSTIFKFFYPYLDADEIDEDVLNAPLIVTNEDFYISNSISLSSNSNNLYINYLYNKPIDIMIFSVERDSRNFISRFFSGFIGFFRHLFGGDIEEYAGSGEISFIPNYYYTINNTDWYNAWKGEEGVFVNSSIPQGYLIDIGCENTENNFYQCPMDKWIIVSSKRNI